MAYDRPSGKRRGSNGDTGSSSSGTPSDTRRSLSSRPVSNGWMSQEGKHGQMPYDPNSGNAPGYQSTVPHYDSRNSSNPTPASLARPDTDYAWNAEPTDSPMPDRGYNGRPVSPDGWPTKKTEVRGHTEEVPDLLSTYVETEKPKIVSGKSSGWKTTSSNVSRNTIVAAKEIPLPASEVDSMESSRFARFTPSSATSAVSAIPETVSSAQGWATARSQASSPALIATAAPVSLPTPQLPTANSSTLSHAHPASPISVRSGSSDMPPGQTIRAVSGGPVKVPSGLNGEAAAFVPMPSAPRQNSPQPASQPIDSPQMSTDRVAAAGHAYAGGEAGVLPNAGGEAWVLPNADAIRNNNWIPTIRRSRVSRGEQIPAYTPASSFGLEEENDTWPNGRSYGSDSMATQLYRDDDSIRPSESASNVGLADEISPSAHRTLRSQGSTSHPTRKPMREFQAEKDSELGSSSSSGSLNDNPNARAGGWQRSTMLPAKGHEKPVPLNDAASLTWQNQAVQQQQMHQPPPVAESRQGERPVQQLDRQQQPTLSGEVRHSPISAPVPRRWDSSSQQLVGDLERAATPRGGASAVSAIGHGRSATSTVGSRAGSLSIRGASKYHAESVVLRQELDKIRAQVAQYETVLSSMDAAEETRDAEVEREIAELRQENGELRNRVQQLEAERNKMRNALQPILRMLDLSAAAEKKPSRKGGKSADYLGDYINGNQSTSLQDLTMLSNGTVPMQDEVRQVGW